MELNQLIQFQKVAEYNSLSRAAEELFISQPTLTRAMYNLEEELNVTLFERRKNRIRLNDCGRQMLEQVNRILEEVEKLKQLAENYEQEYQVLNFYSSMPSSLRHFLRKYSKLNPDSRITVVTKTIADSAAEKMLLSGKADVVMCGSELSDPRIAQVLYCIFEMKITVPKDHPLAKKKQVTMADLKGRTFLLPGGTGSVAREAIVKELKKNFHHPDIILEEDFVNFTEMLKNSNYLAFTSPFSKLYHSGNRVILPVTDGNLKVALYLSYLKERSPKVEAFISWMTTHYDDIMEEI